MRRVKYHGSSGEKIKIVYGGFFGCFNKAGQSVFLDKVVFGLREEVVEVFVVLVLFPKHLEFVFYHDSCMGESTV